MSGRDLMADMKAGRGRIDQPKGEKITVGPDERARLKQLRLELGLGQAELSRKIGASQGTISNLERGVHPQMTRQRYARLLRALGAGKDLSADAEAAWLRLVRSAADLNDEQLAGVLAYVEAVAALKKR